MLRNLCLLLVAGLVAAAAPVRVEDAYTIKVKKHAKGDVTAREKQETEQSKVKLEGPDGKIVRESKTKVTTTLAYKETILEKEKGKKAGKLRREYTKAIVKTGASEKALPYQGKTVLIEKKDGKYHFTIADGGGLKGKDAALLNQSFNNDTQNANDDEEIEKALFPKKPVRVEETWIIDPQPFAKSFQAGGREIFPVDKTRSKGTGKLLRVYQKDGKQYGVLDFRIEMPFKGDFPIGKGERAPIQDGSKMTAHITTDMCIDGTSSDGIGEVSTDIDLTAVFKGPDGKEYKMILAGNHQEKSTEKDLATK